MKQFNDIRSYNDDEVSTVLKRLAENKQFYDMLMEYNFPILNRCLGWILQPIVKASIKKKLSRICTVKQFQGLIANYVDKTVKKSIDEIKILGLEKLRNDESYTFISNHRDIVLDPALINYGLNKNNFNTSHIAIGDNLINLSFVQDLMRLNKSFIVKRSITNRRDKLIELQKLSSYVHHCLENKSSIWIAQSEGRAKNGNDITDPAIIKMLELSQRKQEDSLNVTVKKLKIIPIAISYEYDPCDYAKAAELYERHTTGSYQKSNNEDMLSIAAGIKGYKGNIYITFGDLIADDFENTQQVASAIDTQIHQLYYSHPNNLLAWEMYKKTELYDGTQIDESKAKNTIGVISDKKRSEFLKRTQDCKNEHLPWLLQMYAYPLINHYKIIST